MKTTMTAARSSVSAACHDGCSSCAHTAPESFDRAFTVLLDAGILASIIICRGIGNLLAVLGLLAGNNGAYMPGSLRRA